ncbi:MAG TPA: phage antirepressor N-terminal domain-containing protein [Ktedonobacterales bacterium]
MQILEVVTGEKLALAQEQAWIRHFREKGMLLFNASPGLGSKLLSRRRPFTPLRHETVNIEGCSIQIVWLSYRRIAVLLLPLCEAFHLNYSGQLQRIRRNDFLAKHLLLVRVSTKGGMQSLEALVISAIPRLLAGIQMNRLAPEKRPQARALQQRAEEVLKRYVSGPRQPLSQDGPILTAEHRNQVYALARHLRDQTGVPIAVLFAELAATFGVEDMSDIPDAGWEEVAAWFWERRQRD